MNPEDESCIFNPINLWNGGRLWFSFNNRVTHRQQCNFKIKSRYPIQTTYQPIRHSPLREMWTA
uniref:Uncharacterized protein n=1 Tax=viral metagenome TaxID=1070528 RepID=A0A6C0BKI7_9ZZZZ